MASPPPLRNPPQQEVRRQIDAQGNHHEIDEYVRPSRDGVLLVEEQATGPVHIQFRVPEIIDRHDDPGGEGLELPSATVVAQAPDRPQQQRRRNHVKQT